jgi:hypothetical protein
MFGDEVHARCGKPWDEHVTSGAPWWGPRCHDEPVNGCVSEPATQAGPQRDRGRMVRARFAYEPTRDMTPQEAADEWADAARTRGMTPVEGRPVVVVLESTGDLSFVEGEVDSE